MWLAAHTWLETFWNHHFFLNVRCHQSRKTGGNMNPDLSSDNVSHVIWTLFNSVGRVGIPCIEALSLLQQTWVWVPAWSPLLRVTPPLFQCVSCCVFSCSINKKPKGRTIYLKKKKKKKIFLHIFTYKVKHGGRTYRTFLLCLFYILCCFASVSSSTPTLITTKQSNCYFGLI